MVHRLVPAADGMKLKQKNSSVVIACNFFNAPLTPPTGQRCRSAGSCSPHVAGALENTADSGEMGKMLGKQRK